MSAVAETPSPPGRRLGAGAGPRRSAWGIAAAGLVATAAGAIVQPGAFPHAWLAAAVLFSAFPLGSLALLLIHPLTGGRWAEPLIPAFRRATRLMPLLVLIWIPVVLSLGRLYPWIDHPGQNAWYLNPQFAALRGAVYLVVWNSLALLSGVRALAAPGLVLLALTVNFAAIDATESLEPGFNSSAWGMIAMAGMVLLALAAAIARTPMFRHNRADAGKLVLALLCLWQYLDFMQFLIVWQSDLPQEAAWLTPRLYGYWGVVLVLVTLDHFILPFAILLIPRLQRSQIALAAVAAVLVAGEALRTWWIVLPAAPRGIGVLDLAATVGLLALCAALTSKPLHG